MCKCKDRVVITIGRQFGSGAREIGRKVAEELNIPFFDKELLETEAKMGKIGLDDLRLYDEKKPSAYMYSLAFSPYASNGLLPVDMVAQGLQIKTIKTVAGQGSCVIIGRRADKVLRDEYDVLSVFVSAPMENRIERVSKRDCLSEKESQKVIRKADKVRRSYYNAYEDGEWGEAANYHLCIDSGVLGIDNAAAMIIHYLRLNGKLI